VELEQYPWSIVVVRPGVTRAGDVKT
jgi:hypothetical protein